MNFLSELRKVILEYRKNNISEEEILKKMIAEHSAVFTIEEIEKAIRTTPIYSALSKVKIYEYLIYALSIGTLCYMLLSPYSYKVITYIFFGIVIFANKTKDWSGFRSVKFLILLSPFTTDKFTLIPLIFIFIFVVKQEHILFPNISLLTGKMKSKAL